LDDSCLVLILPQLYFVIILDWDLTVKFIFSLSILRMHRQPEHVMTFLLAELGTSGSLDGQQRLVVKGRFAPKNFESILRKYISKFITFFSHPPINCFVYGIVQLWCIWLLHISFSECLFFTNIVMHQFIWGIKIPMGRSYTSHWELTQYSCSLIPALKKSSFAENCEQTLAEASNDFLLTNLLIFSNGGNSVIEFKIREVYEKIHNLAKKWVSNLRM